MVTVSTAAETPPPEFQGGPKPESLSHIDITKLSQSELHALSLCSDSALDLRPPNDAVTPQLNPSFFNASSASRRQTFSRHHHHSVSAIRRHLPNPKPPPLLSSNDPERAENRTIVNCLKDLITVGEINTPPPSLQSPTRAVVQGDMQMVVRSRPRKRRRGEGKPSEYSPVGVVPISDTQLEIVNKNGVVVDLKSLLENGDDFYEAEFRRRSVGLETEEGLLGFLGCLKGQWGSRRKRRRIVGACEFGDWLPIGWKLILALKRKEGRLSVYCRRYVRWSFVYIVRFFLSRLSTLLR